MFAKRRLFKGFAAFRRRRPTLKESLELRRCLQLRQFLATDGSTLVPGAGCLNKVQDLRNEHRERIRTQVHTC